MLCNANPRKQKKKKKKKQKKSTKQKNKTNKNKNKKNKNKNKRTMVTKRIAKKHKDHVRKTQLVQVFCIQNLLDALQALEFLFTLE